MAKTRSRKYQEQKTWEAFAKYVKTRDAIRTTGTLGEVVCHFCGKRLLRGEAQAGHMISRSYSGALFNPQVVFASCQPCNFRYEGNHVLGFLTLIDMTSYEKALAIVAKALQPCIYKMEDLEDIEEGCILATEILEEYYEENAV